MPGDFLFQLGDFCHVVGVVAVFELLGPLVHLGKLGHLGQGLVTQTTAACA